MRRRGGPVSTMAGLILAGSVALSATVLVLGWPGRGGRDEAPRRAAAPTDPYAPVLPGLCRSSAAAAAGDVAGAERVFADTAHGPLHDLARETAASDRAPASRLLEAKQAVERDLERAPSGPAALGPDLARLSATTRAALALTGHPAGHVCES